MPKPQPLGGRRTPFSFELYPPRSPAAALALPATVARLAAIGPEFLSVTYGAGGSSRAASLDLVRQVLGAGGEPMAHLTCVGASHEESSRLVRQFLDAGVARFLAIRGDPPAGEPLPDHGLRTAAELVQLIHRLAAERQPYEESAFAGLRALRAPRPRVSVAVAAFVNAHSAGEQARQMDALLAKQAAGADLALTQLFFSADDYAAFVDRARAAGVALPIVPGIMPVTSPARLRRMLELSGEDEPVDLATRLAAEPTAEGQREIGIEHAADLARAVLAAGAPALHLYTFNRADAALAVLDRLELLEDAGRPLDVSPTH